MVKLLLDHGAEPCQRPCSLSGCPLARAAVRGKCGAIRAMFESHRRKSACDTATTHLLESYHTAAWRVAVDHRRINGGV